MTSTIAERVYEPVHTGLHQVVCCEYVYDGPSKKFNSIQAYFVWQVDERDADGRRRELRKYFNLTLGKANKPSKLRTDLEGIFDLPYAKLQAAYPNFFNAAGEFDLPQMAAHRVNATALVAAYQKADGAMSSKISTFAKVALGAALMVPENYTPIAQREGFSANQAPQEDVPF